MDIKGIEGLTVAQLQEELRNGGKFVVFSYTISVLVMTFKRSSDVHFVKSTENAFVKSLPYTLLSLVAGWWGIPWGFIYTPWAIIQNAGGGTDVTAQVVASMQLPAGSADPTNPLYR